MKTKSATAMVAIFIVATAIMFPAEKRVFNNAAPKRILLKSSGTTIAELKLLKGTFELRGKELSLNKNTGRQTGKSVTIQVANVVWAFSVEAEEIEVVPDPQ